MNKTTTVNIQKPRTDERLLWNIICGDIASKVLLVAHNLKLFPLLAEKPCTLTDICNAIKIDRHRTAEAILAVLVSIELVQVKDGSYSLTSLAEDYLLESSSTYFGGFLDIIIANNYVYSFESLKKAVLTNSTQVYDSEQLFKSHEEQAELARAFTYGMHGHSMAAALAWPELIDLSEHKLLLDIGGGSGAHTIGATLKWPLLQGVIFDLSTACEVAQDFVRRYGLESRIKTKIGNMWSDPFPEADLHFYGDIYHDWSPQKCRFLTQKSFDSLKPAGRIIIHEMLYNEHKTGPFTVAAYDIAMLLNTAGQQYSGHELSVMLAEVGFTDIKVEPSCGYWSIIIGRKP